MKRIALQKTAAFLATSSLLVIVLCLSTEVAGDGPIKHGATYRIRSGYDGGFLTAKYPKFSEDLTIKLGKTVTEDWEGDPGQIWDAIVWPQPAETLVSTPQNGNKSGNFETSRGKDKTFWLHPKGAALNELTGFRMNASNLLQFIEIADTSGTYLIKNTGNGKCLSSQGIDNEVVFETCEELKTVQQWDLEEFFEDRAAVDKTFIYNSAPTTSTNQQQQQQGIRHVCKKVCHLAIVKV